MRSLQLPGFPDRIRERLDALGVNVSAFAAANGLTQMSRYLKGSVPSFDSLTKMATALGVSWQWLLVGDEGIKAMGAISPREPIVLKIDQGNYAVASYRETVAGVSMYEVTSKGIRSEKIAAVVASKEKDRQKL